MFVEEEVGRIFCSEDCIASFFNPEIERLEREYFRRLSNGDLSGGEREDLAHLRWITLKHPDEVWREKTLTGDYRYTLVSEFQPGEKRVWSICICLFLRGEPSFLYLAFPTRNAAMVNHYRRGERVQWIRGQKKSKQPSSNAHEEETGPQEELSSKAASSAPAPSDRLADAWTEDETFLAQTNQERSSEDIRPEDFNLYQSCLEETLETPDEVWSTQQGGDSARKLYHFIKYYPDEKPSVWYIIVARETEDEEQIEILDAFPTRDAEFVERYRRGTQEVGHAHARPTQRVVH